MGQRFAPEVVLPHHGVIQQQEAKVGNHLSRDHLTATPPKSNKEHLDG